jgi:hypothetical protein
MSTTCLRVERIKGGDGDGDIKTSQANEKVRYMVVFSDSGASAYDARNATSSNGNVPVYGAQLTTISGTIPLYLTGKTATRSTQNSNVWTVECTYTTLSAVEVPPKPAGWTTGDKYGVQVSCRSLPFTEEVQVDLLGNPIANVLGFPINPPLTRTGYDQQIEVTFYTDAPDQTSINQCIGCANEFLVSMTIGATTWQFSAGTFRFTDYSWEVNYGPDGDKVFRVTFTFVFKVDYWYDIVTNSSFYRAKTPRAGIGTITLTANDTVPITDGQPTPAQPYNGGSATLTGAMVVTPRFLDSTGEVIPNGVSLTLTNGGKLQFQTIALIDFSDLLDGVP